MNKSPSSLAAHERDELIRRYAAGEVAWHELRDRGFDNYLAVLAELGEHGLRPPMAPMEGPNLEARQRGRALIRRLLNASPS